jgi:hypothetical protein
MKNATASANTGLRGKTGLSSMAKNNLVKQYCYRKGASLNSQLKGRHLEALTRLQAKEYAFYSVFSLTYSGSNFPDFTLQSFVIGNTNIF